MRAAKAKTPRRRMRQSLRREGRLTEKLQEYRMLLCGTAVARISAVFLVF